MKPEFYNNKQRFPAPPEPEILDNKIVPVSSYAHNVKHVNGTDDIQNATASQKGLATATQITKLDGIEIGADVTDATNVNAAGAVMESDYDAQTILQATSDNTPVALTVGEQTLVGRITSGNITALTVAQIITLLGATSRTFLVNAFQFPDPISEWEPTIKGAYLSASLTAKRCWLPLNFLKLGDIITAYNLVGDAIETTALTLDCKLVRVNKANPLTTTDITNGGMTQVTADGNFDVAVNPDDETVITDSQYCLEITGTTGLLDEIYVTGAEITITRLI